MTRKELEEWAQKWSTDNIAEMRKRAEQNKGQTHG